MKNSDHSAAEARHIALVGFPNSGKTTLFNQLTGLRQKIGNWPGVTVEKKAGDFQLPGGGLAYLIDLPGIHSLLAFDTEALDAKIARRFLLDEKPDLIVNVVDAHFIERDLYLTHELIELGIPLVILLSKTEVAKRRGFEIDSQALSEALTVPVLEADKLERANLVRQLSHCLAMPLATKLDELFKTLPEPIVQILSEAEASQSDGHPPGDECKGIALHALEGDAALQGLFHFPYLPEGCEDIDTLIADWRFERVHQLSQNVLRLSSVVKVSSFSKLDAFLMHAYWGIPSFLLVMYLLFTVSIGLGSLFQPAFDLFSDESFVQLPLYLGQYYAWPALLTATLVGVGKGINTTFSFIPVLFFMYFFLAFLEQSGYMVRAAVIVDRLMRRMGLSGKAFIPLIIGFGCNVPAVMAARTLENPRDRVLTAMMAPFMSCGARLAIFSVFVSLFFSYHAHWVVFSLYLIGIVVAILTGLFVKRFMLEMPPTRLVMELPHYQWPSVWLLVRESWARVKHFIRRTGQIIVPLCLILTLLSRVDLHGHFLEMESGQSLLAGLGRSLAWLFYPMGISKENWPAVIGLLSGTVAKEVVIGTLNTLYSAPEHLQAIMPAFHTLPSRLISLLGEQAQSIYFWITHPWQAMLAPEEMQHGAKAALVHHFQNGAAAYAYLLFVLLYVPCFSTVAAIRRELNSFWAWFSVGWAMLVAYFSSVLVYQCLTFSRHVSQSSITLLLVFVSLLGSFFLFRRHFEKNVFKLHLGSP